MHLVPGALEGGGEDAEDVGVVVDEQDLGHRRDQDPRPPGARRSVRRTRATAGVMAADRTIFKYTPASILRVKPDGAARSSMQ